MQCPVKVVTRHFTQGCLLSNASGITSALCKHQRVHLHTPVVSLCTPGLRVHHCRLCGSSLTKTVISTGLYVAVRKENMLVVPCLKMLSDSSLLTKSHSNSAIGVFCMSFNFPFLIPAFPYFPHTSQVRKPLQLAVLQVPCPPLLQAYAYILLFMGTLSLPCSFFPLSIFHSTSQNSKHPSNPVSSPMSCVQPVLFPPVSSKPHSSLQFSSQLVDPAWC